MTEPYTPDDLHKVAQRGEPSYVWRAGQERRLAMIREYEAEDVRGRLLVNGCGVGEYLARLANEAELAVGLDVEFSRLLKAKEKNKHLVCAAGEHLPFSSGQFTVILSNEVIEHVEDDRMAMEESSRSLVEGGSLILFCPNRGYPFETHGVYWRGKYHFGNILFVNYLPKSLRNRLTPHVRVYTRRDLVKLFQGLALNIERRTTVFGAYDNIIKKRPLLGKMLRAFLHFIEKTPLNRMGLSHFWILRKQ